MVNVQTSSYKAVVIGVSAGGLAALTALLPMLNCDFPAAVVVVQHVRADSDSFLRDYLAEKCHLAVREALDKITIEEQTIYLAPPGYHLLVEADGKTFALSVDAPVNYARPAIDVLFESAARAWKNNLIGIVLTGANMDGAKGLARIKEQGGLTVVQDPDEAEYPIMPKAALNQVKVDYILPLMKIGELLNSLVCNV